MAISQGEIQERLIARARDDAEFRAHLLADPKEAIEKLTGVTVPAAFRVEVHEESSTSFHLVLPPDSRLSEAEMAQVFGGIGSWNDSHSAQGI